MRRASLILLALLSSLFLFGVTPASASAATCTTTTFADGQPGPVIEQVECTCTLGSSSAPGIFEGRCTFTDGRTQTCRSTNLKDWVCEPQDFDALAPVISPAAQSSLVPGEVLHWRVTARRDPLKPASLRMDYGDGTSELRSIPQGTGDITLSFAHALVLKPFPDRDVVAQPFIQTATIDNGGIPGLSLTMHACA